MYSIYASLPPYFKFYKYTYFYNYIVCMYVHLIVFEKINFRFLFWLLFFLVIYLPIINFTTAKIVTLLLPKSKPQTPLHTNMLMIDANLTTNYIQILARY